MSDILLNILTDLFGDIRGKNVSKHQYQFDCPLCSLEKGKLDGDGKGNLEINIKKNVFKCWVCESSNKMHGSIQSLIKRFGNKKQLKQYSIFSLDDFDDEVKPNVELALPKEFIRFHLANPNSIAYKQAFNYLRDRGIDNDLIQKYDLGFASYGPYKNRIICPSYDSNGKLNYFVTRSYINNHFKYKNPAINKDIIFNERNVCWDSTVYLVEGVFDAMVLPNAVPLLGKHLTNQLFLNIFTKSMSYVVIILDPDAWDNAIELFHKLNIGRLRGKVKLVKLPEDYDISDIYRFFGLEGIKKVLKSAQ